MDNGVYDLAKRDISPANNSTKPRFNAMSKYAKPAHRSVAKAIGFALTLGDEAAWHGLTIVLMARLSDAERAALAFASLNSLSEEHACMTASAALGQGAGQPIAPLFSQMDEAAFWADMAKPGELEAYCLVSFNRMAPGRQMAFLDFAVGEALGVDHKTVGNIRDDMEGIGEIPQCDRATSDGRVYPAKRKPIRTEFIAASKDKAHDA